MGVPYIGPFTYPLSLMGRKASGSSDGRRRLAREQHALEPRQVCGGSAQVDGEEGPGGRAAMKTSDSAECCSR